MHQNNKENLQKEPGDFLVLISFLVVWFQLIESISEFFYQLFHCFTSSHKDIIFDQNLTNKSATILKRFITSIHYPLIALTIIKNTKTVNPNAINARHHGGRNENKSDIRDGIWPTWVKRFFKFENIEDNLKWLVSKIINNMRNITSNPKYKLFFNTKNIYLYKCK